MGRGRLVALILRGGCYAPWFAASFRSLHDSSVVNAAEAKGDQWQVNERTSRFRMIVSDILWRFHTEHIAMDDLAARPGDRTTLQFWQFTLYLRRHSLR